MGRLMVAALGLCLALLGLTDARRVYDSDPPTTMERIVGHLGAHPELLRLSGANAELLNAHPHTEEAPPSTQDAICDGCLTVMGFVKSLIRIGIQWPAIRDDVVAICVLVVNASDMNGPAICPTVIDNSGPLVYQAIKESGKNAKNICIHMNWCDPFDLPTFFGTVRKRDVTDAYIGGLQQILDNVNKRKVLQRPSPKMDSSRSQKYIPDSSNRKLDEGHSKVKMPLIPRGVRIDDLPLISKIVDDLKLRGTVLPKKLAQFIKFVNSPKNWEKRLPLKKLLADSKLLQIKLNRAIQNVMAKDKLAPNARKMAETIADGLTRTSRRIKRHLSSRYNDALKVVHLADIHVEVEYTTGAPTECGYPVCCRPESDKTGSAGPWGDGHCNSSPETIRRLIRSAASHDPEFVIFTGDNPPHTVWLETLEGQLNASRWTVRQLTAGLPGKKVYPNIGNHENFPVNMYYVPRPETQTLNREWGNMFQDLAGFGEEQLSTINKAGYYTTLARPGLRIVAFNSNYGGSGNAMNLLNYNRPEFLEMITWLEQTLSHARNSSERVLLTSHHEYGFREMVIEFDEIILAILAKYSDVIAWHTVGHVHRDEFRLNFDPVTGDPVGVCFIAMAMTPYPHVNPGYRVWYFDPVTYAPIDYEQYNIDIQEANEHPESDPVVRLSYRASEQYDLDDLSPASMLDLYYRLIADDTLLQRYWYLRRSGTMYEGTCDTACKESQSCHIISPTYDVYRNCMRAQMNGRK